MKSSKMSKGRNASKKVGNHCANDFCLQCLLERFNAINSQSVKCLHFESCLKWRQNQKATIKRNFETFYQEAKLYFQTAILWNLTKVFIYLWLACCKRPFLAEYEKSSQKSRTRVETITESQTTKHMTQDTIGRSGDSEYLTEIKFLEQQTRHRKPAMSNPNDLLSQNYVTILTRAPHNWITY